jgi:hypothetical protein
MAFKSLYAGFRSVLTEKYKGIQFYINTHGNPRALIGVVIG